jgi:putative flippase GtrA
MFLALFSWMNVNYLVALTVALIISSCLKFLLYRRMVFGRHIGQLNVTNQAAGNERMRGDGS